jgi:hypothetical protein
MKTILKVAFVFLFIYILVGKTDLTGDSKEQESWEKWEIAAAVSLAAPHLDTSYKHVYSPTFMYASNEIVTSTAIQVLNITDKNSTGVSMLLNRFVTEKIGIQLVGEYHRTPLGGTNNSYYTYLQYIDYPPPNYSAKLLTSENHMDWPQETDGFLKQATFGLNLLARLNPGRTVTVDISGGPCLFHFKGEISQIGFTRHVFAHFILVPNMYKLSAAISSTVKLGLNIGGEVNVSLMRGLAIFVSCRYFLGTKASSDIHLKEVLNTNEGYSPVPVEGFEAQMNLQPLKVNPSFLSLSAGLKLKL